MHHHFWSRRGPIAAIAALALGALLTPLAAVAQDLPSYATGPAASADETIHGRIASVNGAFSISVNDDRGFVDSVELHQGTIINPTGLSLAPGMSVTILGYNAGSVFDANQIDTPYSYSGPLPTPVYYGPGYWCPGFAYGYGPSFSLAIIFGDGYRFEHRGFYGRPWDGHRYFGGYVGYGGVYGGRRHLLRSDVRAGYAHAPSAFVGRSFAGHGYAERAFPERGFPGRAYPARASTGGFATRSYAATRAPYAARNFAGQPGTFNRGFTQRGGGFTQRSGGFTQRSGGFTQRSGGFTQRSGGFTQRSGGFAPRGGGFARASMGGGRSMGRH